MDHESPAVTGEREPKRFKRFIIPPSESSSAPSTVSSTPTAVPSTPPSSTITLGRDVVSPQTSDLAKIKVAAAPIDTYNRRGIRGKASLDLLEGDAFTIRAGVERRWVFPRRLLNSRSPYIARMPSDRKIYTLTRSAGEFFGLFAQWLYLGEPNFDGVDVSSRFLVGAWFLGDTFGCPAFKDHVMVQLIKLHRERGINPLRFCDIYESSDSGSKLRSWAIDQFYSKLAYGYTGYDDHMDGDHPNDKDFWKDYATTLKHFSQDFLEACLDAGQGMNRVKKPWRNGQRYMEVLSYADIGGCKEEGRSPKVEATLMKAERR